MAGLIDVQPRLLRQGGEQFFVGCLQAGTDFLHQLGQLAAADRHADHVAEKLADRGERSVTDSLEKSDQCRHAWPHQAGLDHFPGERGVVHEATAGTPIRQTAMLLDAQRHGGDLHLLDDARRGVGFLQGTTAVRATVQGVGVGGVDLFRRKLRPALRLMTRLTAAAAFPAVLPPVLGLLDNITGGRFR